MDFLADLRKTGFVDIASGGETGFNSSPKTRGMLVCARKPSLQNRNCGVIKNRDIHAPSDAEAPPQNVFEDRHLTARAITLGAEQIKWNFFALVLIE